MGSVEAANWSPQNGRRAHYLASNTKILLHSDLFSDVEISFSLFANGLINLDFFELDIIDRGGKLSFLFQSIFSEKRKQKKKQQDRL